VLNVEDVPLAPTEQVPPPTFDDVPVRPMRAMGARKTGPAGRVTLSSWWRALGAGLVELVLVVVPAAGVGFLAAENRSIASAPSVVEGVALTLATETRALVAFAIAAFVLHVLHNAVTVPELGGTLGCRMFGIRVASRTTGRRLGLARAALRGALSAGGALLCFAGPLFGVFVDPLRRGLGDLVAGTVLIRPPFVPAEDGKPSEGGDAGDGG
jgi:uncharacterized RDD family membrane protein YckC